MGAVSGDAKGKRGTLLPSSASLLPRGAPCFLLFRFTSEFSFAADRYTEQPGDPG